MKDHSPREDSARVLLVATALWGAAVGIPAFEGAFARFEGSALAALALFVCLYVAVALQLDAGLRAYAASVDVLRVRALAAALGLALLGALMERSTPLAMFLAPLATLAGVAAAQGVRRRATSASPAKSPGASRAAI